MTFPKGPLRLEPLKNPVNSKPYLWPVPGSKSITNRAFVLAALAPGITTLRGVLHSDDTRHMRNALSAMGIRIEDIDTTTVKVYGGLKQLQAPEKSLFIGNSGTTVRFLTAFCSLVPGAVTLVGDEHMAKRPVSDLVAGLHQLGTKVDCPSGCPPITIHGGGLSGGEVTMPGNRSSQYFSALLMAATAAESTLRIKVAGSLVSRPYIDITLRMMEAFGARCSEENGEFIVEPCELTAQDYQIEPDASSASYAFGTAAATGMSIEVPGLTRGALQGDYGFVELLAEAGCTVEQGPFSTTVTGPQTLKGLDVDMHHISDTVMTLAALAPVFGGSTRIRNVENIRIKETDRLEATVCELKRLGQNVRFGQDWLSVEPMPVKEAVVLSYSDHRMAMAFALLGLVRPGVSIEDPSCVAKTYPHFWADLKKLYAHNAQEAPY